MGQEEIIAKRYAAGLAEQAAATDSVEETRRGLHLLASAVNPRAEGYVAEMAAFLASPRVGAEEKIKAADGILRKLGAGETAGNFFKLLIGRGRAGLLPRIEAHFNETAGRLTGELAGGVETARPLTEEQLSRLGGALAAAFGRPVRLRQTVNENLLAGAKITVGDKTFDGSALGKWRRLRDRLSGGVATECGLRCDRLCAVGGDESKGDDSCAKN